MKEERKRYMKERPKGGSDQEKRDERKNEGWKRKR